jgi:hypothetical protein
VPFVPEAFRGKAFALVEAVFTGSEEEGKELLAPLRALGPAIDTFALVPPAEIAELHMDPPHPVAGLTGHSLLGPLGAQGIDDFVAAAGPTSGSSLLSVELRQLGGALARTAAHHGAIDRLRAEFAMFSVGMAVTPEMADATAAGLEQVDETLSKYDVGLYANFTEHRVSADRFFEPETTARLRAVKEAWDPDGLFRANYAID